MDLAAHRAERIIAVTSNIHWHGWDPR